MIEAEERKLADEARRMPGRAAMSACSAREATTSALWSRGQMIGGRAADDAAADDHDPRRGPEGHCHSGPCLLEIVPAPASVAAEIFFRIGDIIDARRIEMKLRNHAPHGFAQGRGRLHGIEARAAALHRCGAEIGFEQHALFSSAEGIIRGDIGEVEHGVPKPPYSQSISHSRLPVIHEIGGQKIVMAEDDRKRNLGILHRIGEAGIMVEVGFGTGAAFAQAIGIVADDVKHPEEGRGPLYESSHLMVAFPDQRHDAGEVGAQIVLAIGAAGDMAENHDAGFRMDELGRQAGAMGGTAHGALAVAEDVMDRDIAAAAGDEFFIPVGDDKRGVAQAALQRFEQDFGLPAAKVLEAKFERQNGCHGWVLRVAQSVAGGPDDRRGAFGASTETGCSGERLAPTSALRRTAGRGLTG